MNYFDMEIGDEPIMGITKNTADRVLRRQMRYGGEMKTHMDSTIEYMDMRLLSHRHNCAEHDEDFLQVVPCVMVQGVPTRMVRTVQGNTPGYDGKLISLCAHDHIRQNMTIRETVDMLLERLHIAPDQVMDKIVVGISIPNEKPACGKHLLVMYLCRVIDFRERDEELRDASLLWVDPCELREPQRVERFDPWCRLTYPYLLTVADATARDITMRFFMEDGKQKMQIIPNRSIGA